jgi:DNA-binding MarR family transcriptional regulator
MSGMTSSKDDDKTTKVVVQLSIKYPGDLGTIQLSGTLDASDAPESIPQLMIPSRMDINNALKRLEMIHDWERLNFPHWTPKIGIVLFKLLGEGKRESKGYTMKEIIHATGFSERAIRKQLDRFEANGWLIRGKNNHDRRNNHIEPSESLRKAYLEWLSLHINSN